MTKFYSQPTKVRVSFYDNDLFYTGSATLSMQKDTGLPKNCTDVVFTPTDPVNKIGVYNPASKTWSELATDHGKKYWSIRGAHYVHSSHRNPLPHGVVTTAPPNVALNQVVEWDGNSWQTFDNSYGKVVYNQSGGQHVCIDTHYKLKADESFDPKPTTNAKAGHEWQVINGKWKESKFKKEVIAYDKKTGSSKILLNVFGKIPSGYTEKPHKAFHVWDSATNTWKYDQKLEEPHKKNNEEYWIREQINETKSKLLDELLHRTFNTNHKAKSQSDTDKLLKYIKDLEDYPKSNDFVFPYSKRPKLS